MQLYCQMSTCKICPGAFVIVVLYLVAMTILLMVTVLQVQVELSAVSCLRPVTGLSLQFFSAMRLCYVNKVTAYTFISMLVGSWNSYEDLCNLQIIGVKSPPCHVLQIWT